MTGDTSGEIPASPLLVTPGERGLTSRDCLVEVTIPVYNEERVLAESVRRLHAYLTANLHLPFVIVIADNASTDGTFAVAQCMCAELPWVRAVHLDRKGRGLALHHVWSSSDADIVAYMDADLSTGLEAFGALIAPLLLGHCDLAIGSRLSPGAEVTRGAKRQIISRVYNLLLRVVLSARFRDAQCGFKAGRTEVIKALLPFVEDDVWFFDTELLMLAQHEGFRVCEIPVTWVEDTDSKVKIVRTALADLRGIARIWLAFHFPGKQRRGTRSPCRSEVKELAAPEQH
jgi:glycosyltransferase involved in cell wall biosynthesis